MSDKKRNMVLEAATELFSKSGYHAVGIDLIVKKSNVAKMTLYKHFQSKDELIESVLKKRDHDLRESIMVAMDKRRTPKNKIKAIFDWYEAWFNLLSFQGCMFIKASEEFPEPNNNIKKASQDHKEWVTNNLINLLEKCEVHNSNQLAKYILVVLDGLTVRVNMCEVDVSAEVKASWKYLEQNIIAEVNKSEEQTQNS